MMDCELFNNNNSYSSKKHHAIKIQAGGGVSEIGPEVFLTSVVNQLVVPGRLDVAAAVPPGSVS
jgi:hypothetical protein